MRSKFWADFKKLNPILKFYTIFATKKNICLFNLMLNINQAEIKEDNPPPRLKSHFLLVTETYNFTQTFDYIFEIYSFIKPEKNALNPHFFMFI